MSEIKFTSVGNKIDLLVNGEKAILGKWYPYNSIFQVRNKSGFKGEPFDQVKYVYRNEDKLSNEASIDIDFPPNKNKKPSSENKNVTLENNKEYSLMDFISHNDAVDRIKIVDFDSTGVISLNGRNVYKGQVILMEEFPSIEFETKTGIGNPYNSIKYQVGNSNEYSDIYIIESSIYGYAKFKEQVISETINKEDNTINYSISNKIENGIVNGIAKFIVQIDSNSNEIFNPELNTSVVINDKEILKTGTYEFNLKVNDLGEVDLNIEVISTSLISGGGVYFVVEASSINENESIIQGRNKNNFLINL